MENKAAPRAPLLSPTGTPVVQMRNISKFFPGVVANDHVDFDLRKGEVHALLGENGAGKTTPMNILYGILKPDEGEIYVRGKKVSINSPADAIALGIGMVHQNFKLIPTFSVADNIALCLQSVKNQKGNVKQIIKDISEKYGLGTIDLGAEAQTLPPHEQQLVEIIKMLGMGQQILIFDEPTSVLVGEQINILIQRIRKLAEAGHSIVFISHKLHEVLEVSDRITVTRKGKVVGTLETSKANRSILVNLMIGHDLPELTKPKAELGEKMLELEHVNVYSDRGLLAVNDASFTIHQGEIVGVAGVAGNGQVELVEALNGMRKIASGKVIINGKDTTHASAREIIDQQVSYIPPKPKENAVAQSLNMTENIMLRNYSTKFRNHGILKLKEIDRFTCERVEEFNIMCASRQLPVSLLSGGNLMKLVVAREIAKDPKVFIIFDPTTGLDVGSTDFVHKRIVECRQTSAILLISTDLDEVLQLSDRVLVMYNGKIKTPPAGFNREKLGFMMTGEDK